MQSMSKNQLTYKINIHRNLLSLQITCIEFQETNLLNKVLKHFLPYYTHSPLILHYNLKFLNHLKVVQTRKDTVHWIMHLHL